MIVLDSSCWISIFKGEPGAEKYVDALNKADKVLVPSICIYEVGKLLIRELDEDLALEAIATMKQYRIIAIDADIALKVAFIAIKYRTPFADSIILTIAKNIRRYFGQRTLTSKELKVLNILSNEVLTNQS